MKTDKQTKPKAKDSTPEKIGSDYKVQIAVGPERIEGETLSQYLTRTSRTNAEFKEHIRQLNGDKATVTGASHAHSSLVRTPSIEEQ